jgi:hypothetical protein
MAKLKTLIFIFVLLSTATFSYANWTNPQDNGDGTPIYIKQSVGNNSNDRGQSINTFINGHSLTVAFSQNLGEVSIDVSTATGATIFCLSVQTPTGYQYYIPTTGSYVVTFTLPNGDEYYGEFEVND